MKPANDAHSIQAVALVLEFPAEVQPEGLTFLAEASKRFRNKLNMRSVIRQAEFSLSIGEMQPLRPNAVAGYRYFTKKQDGTDKQWFEVSGNRAIFCATDYTDFNSFRAEAFYFLDLACQAFRYSEVEPNKITLKYRDEFRSNEFDWEPYQLLNSSSIYLTHGAIKKSNMWHSHFGFFDKTDGCKILNTGRIDHVHGIDGFDDSQFSQVNIVLTHALEIPKKESRGNWADHLEGLREVHLDHLRDILSSEAALAIGLRKEKC